jgi:hypothetical protein
VIVAVIVSLRTGASSPSRRVTTIDAVAESVPVYVLAFEGAVVASAVAVNVSPATR